MEPAGHCDVGGGGGEGRGQRAEGRGRKGEMLDDVVMAQEKKNGGCRQKYKIWRRVHHRTHSSQRWYRG